MYPKHGMQCCKFIALPLKPTAVTLKVRTNASQLPYYGVGIYKPYSMDSFWEPVWEESSYTFTQLLEVFLPQCSHGNKETKKSGTRLPGVHSALSSVSFQGAFSFTDTGISEGLEKAH